MSKVSVTCLFQLEIKAYIARVAVFLVLIINSAYIVLLLSFFQSMIRIPYIAEDGAARDHCKRQAQDQCHEDRGHPADLLSPSLLPN